MYSYTKFIIKLSQCPLVLTVITSRDKMLSIPRILLLRILEIITLEIESSHQKTDEIIRKPFG